MAEHGAERDGSREGDEGRRLDEDAAWAAIVAGYGEEPPDPPGAKPFRSVEDLAGLEAEAANEDRRGRDGAEREPDAPGSTTPAGSPGASGSPGSSASSGSSGSSGSCSSDTADASDSSDSSDPSGKGAGSDDADRNGGRGGGAGKSVGGSITFAPGVGPGPRDYSPSDASDDDFDEDDEGHFVPPEPPPLPEADTTAKFAWLAVVGGPVLLLLAVLFGWDMTWWLTTLGIGGFVGGFATLVLRMQGDDDEDDDPGRGAVV